MTTTKIVEAAGTLFSVTKSSAGHDVWTPLTMSEAAAELTTWKERAAAGEQRIIELQTRVAELTAELEAARAACKRGVYALDFIAEAAQWPRNAALDSTLEMMRAVYRQLQPAQPASDTAATPPAELIDDDMA